MSGNFSSMESTREQVKNLALDLGSYRFTLNSYTFCLHKYSYWPWGLIYPKKTVIISRGIGKNDATPWLQFAAQVISFS